jgi:hypothetical protein
MKRINLRKTFFTIMILAVLSPIALTYQNFSRLDIEKDSNLSEDLTFALKTSDEDQDAQKLAATVETLQPTKKKAKRKPMTIYDGNTLSDSEETIVSESSLAE